jgi:hypothetical protein
MPWPLTAFTMGAFVSAILLMGCAPEAPPPPVITAGSSQPASARGIPGRFDGIWQVEAASVALDPGEEASLGCGSVDVKFQVKNNEIVGGPSAPMSGTVQPDGTVNMFWDRYLVTGKMTGEQVQLQWNGECGARLAAGGRVAS